MKEFNRTERYDTDNSRKIDTGNTSNFITFVLLSTTIPASTTGISGGLIGGVVVMGVVCIGLFFFLLWKIKSNKKALEAAKAYLKDQTEATKREREEGERALEEAAKGIYNVRL